MFRGNYKTELINIQKANLKALWVLNEESGNFVDHSGNENTLTVSGVTLADEVFKVGGNAPSFDGVNDNAQKLSNTALNMGSGDFTLMAWVNVPDVTTLGGIMMQGDTGAGNKRYLLEIHPSSETPQFELDDDSPVGRVTLAASSGISRDVWHQLVGVRDGNNMRLYVDGSEDANSPADITGMGTLDDAEKPDTFVGSKDASQYFLGKMAYVGLWNTALSAAQISRSYNWVF